MIANQKMEYARNLPYNSVGTISGMVTGVMLDDETISQNNGVFFVNTLVLYEDDPFDGLDGGTPDDTLPVDYKIARVRVSWNGPFGTKDVTTFTKIVPRGMETNIGGGTLSILAFDASGLPIDQANVHIENNDVTPAIDFSAETNSSGKLNLYGATSSIESYEITVTKPGYSVSSTTDRTVANPNPTKPHASVIEGLKTEISFAIDLLSDLTIKTVSANLPENWQVNNDASGEAQVNSRIAIDNAGFIYIVWQDDRDGGSGKSRIYAQKYDNSGNAQWPNSTAPDDIKISDANNQVLPDILTDNSGNLYICWNDDSLGNQDAYLMKRASADGSDLWAGAKKVDTAVNNADQTTARIALLQASGGNATTSIVWADNRDTDIDIYMQLYDIDRNEQLTQEIRVNSNAISDNTDQYDPEIISDSADNIYVAWTDDRNTNLDVYAAKFDDNGNILWADKLMNTDGGTAGQYSPNIAADSNDNIYLVWTDERNGDPDIYAQKYDLTGAAQWPNPGAPNDVLINANTDLTNQYLPAIAIDTNNILYIVWTDERNGNQDIYAQKYDVNGNNLWTEDVRVNIDTGSSAQYNPDVTIDTSANPDTPYVTWQSDINGDFDIFASSFGEYTSITNISNVDITVTGAKKIGENPIIYKYNHNFTSNASGEIVLNNIEWDSYSIELQTGYTAYNIVMSDPAKPIDLEPNSAETITLYLE